MPFVQDYNNSTCRTMKLGLLLCPLSPSIRRDGEDGAFPTAKEEDGSFPTVCVTPLPTTRYEVEEQHRERREHHHQQHKDTSSTTSDESMSSYTNNKNNSQHNIPDSNRMPPPGTPSTQFSSKHLSGSTGRSISRHKKNRKASRLPFIKVRVPICDTSRSKVAPSSSARVASTEQQAHAQRLLFMDEEDHDDQYYYGYENDEISLLSGDHSTSPSEWQSLWTTGIMVELEPSSSP